jgi:hypothetical protein
MSHILLKKVQDNLISSPASNYIKIFSNANDGGLLYYKDSSGTPTPIGNGGGSGTTHDPVIGITYSSLYSLYQSDGFATGSFYYISDFQSIYDQPDFYFDGTPKTVLENKVSTSHPIIVLATSNNTLAIDAYQPDFSNDVIKYDITWNETEFSNSAKGRITERIDQYGNRTDYDNRTIRFKRYLDYEKVGSSLSGTITSWDCITGTVSGSSTQFNTDVSVNDVIILDSSYAYGGDKNYTIGLKVKTVINNTTIIVATSSLYAASVPVDVALSNSALIEPENYSFVTKNYIFWLANSTGNYTSYKEIYFGQSDEGEFDEFLTFQTGSGVSLNNYIGNYSHKYLSGSYNNTLILPNNVLSNVNSSYNKIGDDSYNNHFEGFAAGNKISSSFYGNTILGNFTYNNIGSKFYDNYIGDMDSNSIFSEFGRNFTSVTQSFRSNSINIDMSMSILNYNFTNATHIHSSYNCSVFSNSTGSIKLSYYDGYNALTVVDIDA